MLFLSLAAGLTLGHRFHGWPTVAIMATAAAATWGMSRSRRSGWLAWQTLAVSLGIVAASCLWLQAGRLVETRQSEINRAPADWAPAQFVATVETIPRIAPETSPFATTEETGDGWVTLLELQTISTGPPGSGGEPLQQRIMAHIPGRRRDLAIGDRVALSAHWRTIPPPSNPGQFDTQRYWAARGIFAQARATLAEQTRRLDQPQWWRLGRYISRLAMAGDAAIERHVPTRWAPLAAALVLGQRDQIDPTLEQSLLETGTIHMLAISGLHVEMVAVSLTILALCFGLPQRRVLVLVAIGVGVYALVCGGNPPVLRAAFLVGFYTFARLRGLPTRSYNLLAVAAVALILMRRETLFDTGVQLSFLAVGVLIFVASWTRRMAYYDPLRLMSIGGENRWHWDVGWIAWQATAASFWVWLVTTPIVACNFHVVAPVAVLLNLLLMVPLWIALLSGLGVLITAPVVPPLAAFLGLLCGGSLAIVEYVVEVARDIPLGHWWTSGASLAWLIGFYIVTLLAVATLGFGGGRRRLVAVVLSVYIAAGVWPWGQPPAVQPSRHWTGIQPQSVLAVTFLDVGHGTAVMIELPGGGLWLYDAGRMGSPYTSHVPISGAIWHARRDRIDTLMISHADADHFNAVDALLERFRIDVALVAEHWTQSDDPRVAATREALSRAARRTEVVAAGFERQCEGVLFRILHPPPGQDFGSDNANSLCLSIEYAGRKLLLPGDLQSSGLRHLTDTARQRFDVLMAPHHGSLAGDPTAILDWSRAGEVVISGSQRAADRRVKRVFAGTALRDVWVTSEHHAIRYEIAPDGRMLRLHWTDDSWLP